MSTPDVSDIKLDDDPILYHSGLPDSLTSRVLGSNGNEWSWQKTEFHLSNIKEITSGDYVDSPEGEFTVWEFKIHSDDKERWTIFSTATKKILRAKFGNPPTGERPYIVKMGTSIEVLTDVTNKKHPKQVPRFEVYFVYNTGGKEARCFFENEKAMMTYYKKLEKYVGDRKFVAPGCFEEGYQPVGEYSLNW